MNLSPAQQDALKELLPGYDNLIKNGTIEIAPLAFMRGRTLKDAFIILDEIRIDLFLLVAGQEAEPFAGLDRRAAKDDPFDLAALIGGNGGGNGKPCFAGSGVAHAKRNVISQYAVQIVRLAFVARQDFLAFQLEAGAVEFFYKRAIRAAQVGRCNFVFHGIL